MARPAAWAYTLRRNGRRGFALTVPSQIADQIPEGTLFSLSVTTEGLLYSPTTIVNETTPVVLPWVTKETKKK